MSLEFLLLDYTLNSYGNFLIVSNCGKYPATYWYYEITIYSIKKSAGESSKLFSKNKTHALSIHQDVTRNTSPP
ncbi:MAG: hypothetical protein KGY70_02765 [Bacteroidales bacterium]|nr:hypothetical protein [Bacteroidales bacterium]